MRQDEAVSLIAAGVTTRGGVWADLGAGDGTFTRALGSLLGPDGTVYALDRNPAALGALSSDRSRTAARVITIVGDFTAPLELPPLDGVIIANALHYVPYPDQPRVLREIASLLTSGGPIVVVEYDRRSANRWVPYPIAPHALASAAAEAGLEPPTLLATRPSHYSGTIYSAIVRRQADR